MKKFSLFLLPVLCLTTGCATTKAMRSATSGQIGCQRDEIEIIEPDSGTGQASWTALCRGRKFHCSAINQNNSSINGGNIGGATVTCAEDLATRGSPLAPVTK